MKKPRQILMFPELSLMRRMLLQLRRLKKTDPGAPKRVVTYLVGAVDSGMIDEPKEPPTDAQNFA